MDSPEVWAPQIMETHGHYEKANRLQDTDILRGMTPACQAQTPPKPPPKPASGDAGIFVSSLPMIGSFQIMINSQERIELPMTGDKMLIGYDKDSNVILTVYRDGRVEAKDKATITEQSKFFWTEFAKFAKYYREQAAFVGCSQQGEAK